MTTYLAIFTFAISSIFLFSTKTEHRRVVTIQKPMVITQERKTPAYFAYQQSQTLRQIKTETVLNNSTFLTNLNEQPRIPHFQLTEMKLTKSDYADYQAAVYRSRMLASARYDHSGLDYEKVIFQPEGSEDPLDYSDSPTVLSPERRWATVQGKFELRDGVGITDHIIDIKRVEEGLVREQGRINLSAGTYSIEIESPNGYLVAEVRDKSGLIIGEDRQRLVNLQGRGAFLEGPFIKVRRPDETLAGNPSTGTTGAASANWASASGTKVAKSTSNNSGSQTSFRASPASTSGATPLATSIFNDQKILTSAAAEFSNISSLSSTIARIYDPSQIYSNVVTIRMAGEKTETPMFTRSWLSNALNLLSSREQLYVKMGAPILVGKVFVDGQPMAGAQVQLEKLLNAKAIYFDQFLNPSPELAETGANGYFMFIGVDPGAYEAVVFANNHIIGSQLYSAENDNIAFQSVYTKSIPDSQVLRAYDAFTSVPVEADIYVSSQDEIIQTSGGTSAIKNYVDNNISDFSIQTDDFIYAPMHFVQSGKKGYIHLPMIQQKWLNQIKAIKLVNEIPGHGTVIGFTPNLNYEVYLASDSYDKSNIVYFTKEGELSSTPQANGGFIMFNVPEGAKEIVLNNLDNDRIYSQVLAVEGQQLSAVNFGD